VIKARISVSQPYFSDNLLAFLSGVLYFSTNVFRVKGKSIFSPTVSVPVAQRRAEISVIMRMFFKKSIGGASAVWLILTMLGFTPHFYTAILTFLGQQSGWDLSSTGSTGEIVALEVAGDAPGLIPKTAQKLALSCFDRILAGARLIIDRAMQFDEDKIFAEIEVYLLHNDLHYNIPTITYRQPVSTHASEG
jgi:hypothetical protein